MKPKLLIGTKNPSKIKRWSQYFGDMFEIISLKDCGIDVEVEESLDDLRGNSIKKAKTYAKLSQYLTLSEDTGFFMEALGGKPGVAVRRRGGELPNEINDEEYLLFFRNKINHLENTRSYFEYDITIANPDGIMETVNKKSYGRIDKEKLANLTSHEAGYPLSSCFINDFDGKTRVECSLEERAKRDEGIIQKLKDIFPKFL